MCLHWHLNRVLAKTSYFIEVSVYIWTLGLLGEDHPEAIPGSSGVTTPKAVITQSGQNIIPDKVKSVLFGDEVNEENPNKRKGKGNPTRKGKKSKLQDQSKENGDDASKERDHSSYGRKITKKVPFSPSDYTQAKRDRPKRPLVQPERFLAAEKYRSEEDLRGICCYLIF